MRAVRYLQDNGLPNNTPIERVSEGCETAAFKNEFARWDPPQSFKQASVGIAAATPDQAIDIKATLARREAEAAAVDDGSGTVKMWVVENFRREEVHPEMFGQFYGGDAYVILYTYIKNKVGTDDDEEGREGGREGRWKKKKRERSGRRSNCCGDCCVVIIFAA